MKAIRVADVARPRAARRPTRCRAFLLDAASAGLRRQRRDLRLVARGGGRARAAGRSSPAGSGRRTWRRRCGRSGRSAVDVASGVESRARGEGRRADGALHPAREGGVGMTDGGRPTRAGGSARTAGGSCRRRWSRRSTSSRRPGARRARTRSSRASSYELLTRYAGRETPLSEARRMSADVGRLPRAPEARGPLPHRRAQDQQHPRPGAARAAHGQAAHHRRDRRGPARRRDRDRRGALRPALRRLHGRARRRAAGAQRLPHAAPRRARRPGRGRLAHAQGRDERGAARLGDERPGHPLHHRLGGRARTPTRRWSATSSRSSARRRAGRCSTLAGRLPDAVVACVGGGSNAMGIFTAFLDDRAGAARRRRGGRARPLAPGSTAPRSRRGRPGVLHGSRSYVLQDATRPDRRGPLHLRRARLPGRRARSSRT